MVMQSGRYSHYPNRTYTRIDVRSIYGGRNVSMNIGNGTIDIHEYVGRDSHYTSSITVAGVQTTQERLDALNARLSDVERAIGKSVEQGQIDETTAEQAQAALDEFADEIRQPRRPRNKRFITAGRVLLRLSPLIVGAMISVFSDPLMGEITQQAGEAAVRLAEHAFSLKHTAVAASTT